MEYNYTALVLKKRKVGETDRLYTLYTLEAGKIQSIGRGIRKPQAKLASHLETLNQVDVIVARRHGLGNIASAIAERSFDRLKSDESILGMTLGTVRMFERVVDFEEKDEVLFGLLQTYLVVGNEIMTAAGALFVDREKRVRVLTQGFLLQTADRLGYRVDMRRCVVSGEALDVTKRYVFRPDRGGVSEARFICDGERSVAVSASAIKLVRILLENRLTSLDRLRVDAAVITEVERVSLALFHWIGR
jgi:DNA repair protein RecO (recombination protein O)